MHDGVDLFGALRDTMSECKHETEKLMHDGITVAECKRNYRQALAKRQLELREVDKLPATLIHDVSRGDELCSQLRCELDCAEAIYGATYQRIQILKREADIIREQINRELSRGGQ